MTQRSLNCLLTVTFDLKGNLEATDMMRTEQSLYLNNRIHASVY